MKLATKVIHGVESEKTPGNSVVTPVHQTSIFYLGDKEYQNITTGHPENAMLYTRYNNPTIEMLEGKIASLEGADRALVFSSGLGAISATVTAFAGAGDSVVTSLDIYGGTLGLFQKELARMGIEFIFVDPEEIDSIPDDNKKAIADAIRTNIKDHPNKNRYAVIAAVMNKLFSQDQIPADIAGISIFITIICTGIFIIRTGIITLLTFSTHTGLSTIAEHSIITVRILQTTYTGIDNIITDKVWQAGIATLCTYIIILITSFHSFLKSNPTTSL